MAGCVSATYAFDDVQRVPVSTQRPDAGAAAGSPWHVTGGPLDWSFEVGRHQP